MPNVAGLLDDGSLYLDVGDGLWHLIPDDDTANALGVDRGSIQWYGSLPGDIGDPVPSVDSAPAPSEPTGEPSPPPPAAGAGGSGGGDGGGGSDGGGDGGSIPAGTLAGTVGDGRVYVMGDDGLWHWIPDQATFNAHGYVWTDINWIGSLPGPTGAPIGATTSKPGTPDFQDVVDPDGRVYRYDTTGKWWRHIPDAATAAAMGVNFDNLHSVDSPPLPQGPDWPKVASGPPGSGAPGAGDDTGSEIDVGTNTGIVYGTFQPGGSGGTFMSPTAHGKPTAQGAWRSMLDLWAKDIPAATASVNAVANTLLRKVA